VAGVLNNDNSFDCKTSILGKFESVFTSSGDNTLSSRLPALTETFFYSLLKFVKAFATPETSSPPVTIAV